MAAKIPVPAKSVRRTSTRSKPLAPAPALVNEITAAVISRVAPARVALIPESVRREMVAETAYFLAERRGFQPGHEEQDWLQAEAQIEEIIARRYSY